MVQRYIPAKIAPWQRKWKTLTYFITVGSAYYFILWHDWTRVNLIPPDHVFARVRPYYELVVRLSIALVGPHFLQHSLTNNFFGF